MGIIENYVIFLDYIREKKPKIIADAKKIKMLIILILSLGNMIGPNTTRKQRRN